MPTYDYMCSTCGATFEFVQSMKDDALTMCPESVCEQAVKGSGQVTRKISGGTGVIYKGQGFYLTDYANKGSDNVAATASTDKSDAKNESAPEKPSPEKPSAQPASSKETSSSNTDSNATTSKPSTPPAKP